MEGNSSYNKLNHQLNQFVFQMQAQLGCSGKTFHQISTEYLELKSENPALAEKIEELDIPDAEFLSFDQFHTNCEILHRFELLRSKVLDGLVAASEHPWHAFGHPDLPSEEFELMLRTLRFVSIQLSKFWVEVQSFPLFLNSLENLPIKKVEEIFHWLTDSPPWHEIIHQPRVITPLTEPKSRKLLIEFVRDVKSARVLCEKAALHQSATYLSTHTLQTGFALLGEGTALTAKYKLDAHDPAELEADIAIQERQLEGIRRIRRFFARLNDQTGLPSATHVVEASNILKLKDAISKIPKRIMPWRLPQILAPNQLVRIQALQDRARPLLEGRKRIAARFHIKSVSDPQKIRNLAAKLSTGGLLKSFKLPYQEAQRAYQIFLTAQFKHLHQKKETSLQMSESLNEWASFLEQSEAFDKNVDISKTFGPLFRGIDTAFELAIEANQWAAQLRAEFAGEETVFCESLIQFIFKATQDELDAVSAFLRSEEATDVAELIKTRDLRGSITFDEFSARIEVSHAELTRLFTIVRQLEIQNGISFSILKELLQTNEEIIFLNHQIDASADIKSWLKGYHRGIDTDLSVVEQAASYVRAIEQADIPDSLKRNLLSVHGPQRFGENRALVAPALNSLHLLKDQLVRLEAVCRAPAQKHLEAPIPRFQSQLQNALKHPALLGEWVAFLGSERDVRNGGLGAVLDFLDTLPAPAAFKEAYRMAYFASLLKRGLGPTTL